MILDEIRTRKHGGEWDFLNLQKKLQQYRWWRTRNFQARFEGFPNVFWENFLNETFSNDSLDYPVKKISPKGVVSKEKIELEGGWSASLLFWKNFCNQNFFSFSCLFLSFLSRPPQIFVQKTFFTSPFSPETLSLLFKWD